MLKNNNRDRLIHLTSDITTHFVYFQKMNASVAIHMENKVWLDFYKGFLFTVLFQLTPVIIVAVCKTLMWFQIIHQHQWRRQGQVSAATWITLEPEGVSEMPV